MTLREAEARPGGGADGAATNGRPTPGVYAYTGSGIERLSLPPLSLSEETTIPGTVSLVGADWWVLRFDYSNHHWKTWRYFQRGADLWEEGGEALMGPVTLMSEQWDRSRHLPAQGCAAPPPLGV